MIADQEIARVRSFNRLVTRQVGALSDRYLGRLPLGEARVLFEIGTAGSATPRDVRTRLGLDSGYLSRVLGSLKRHGLVEETPDPRDRRTKRLRLTAAGRAEQRKMDEASNALAAATLDPLTDEQRERLLRAEDEVRRLLALSMFTVGLEEAASSDARWCLDHYYDELDERFEEGFEAPGPEEVSAFVVARIGGEPAGCGALKTLEPGIGEIARVWVDRPHRGLGLSPRLLAALEEQAVRLGHRRLRLDTNRALDEAKAMYRSRGYAEIERYNDNPYANHWFEKVLAAD
jgi:DNA-binding MarR family transcriptional regulator/N-acetylglutamate synthase-like GNAT family acetyltransferase